MTKKEAETHSDPGTPGRVWQSHNLRASGQRLFDRERKQDCVCCTLSPRKGRSQGAGIAAEKKTEPGEAEGVANSSKPESPAVSTVPQTTYTISRAQCKMKMQGPSFRKEEKLGISWWSSG